GPEHPAGLLHARVRRQSSLPERRRHARPDRGGDGLPGVPERRQLRQRAHLLGPAVVLDPPLSDLQLNRLRRFGLQSGHRPVRGHPEAEQHPLPRHRRRRLHDSGVRQQRNVRPAPHGVRHHHNDRHDHLHHLDHRRDHRHPDPPHPLHHRPYHNHDPHPHHHPHHSHHHPHAPRRQ